LIKRTKQYLIGFIGMVSLTLGVIGVVLPILPTTPFILLAAFCFARSSSRLDRWVRNHAIWGKVILQFSDGKGITKAIKIKALALVWSSLIISMLVVSKTWSTVLLTSIGMCLTAYLLYLPTRQSEESN
jgi:uncharacterized protein